MTWSAQQYVAFETERTRPVRDLLASVPRADARVAIDLGCGPGNSTEALGRRFPGASISGLDSSPDMIEAARQRLPGVEFVLADVEAWLHGPPTTPRSTSAATPAHFDVILANAILQWLPDHARLIPALLGRLTVGGVLAVIATADWYYSLIRSVGAQAEIWRTTYYHPLAGGAGAIVEWFKGSGLRPYLALLTPAERADYLARYEAAVALAHPSMADGTVLLPVPRLFLVVVR